MKKNFTFIVLAMLLALSTVSCNNKKAQEPTQEEITDQKQQLADTVLILIDDAVAKYVDVSDTADLLAYFNLTEKEKQIKPDYLLEPSQVNTFVTKEQKINGLAIYMMEYYFRKIYDMPTAEVKEAIAKLAVDLNHPVDMEELTSGNNPSIIIKKEYATFKERGELDCFWQFQYAVLAETDYLLAHIPDLYVKYVTDEVNNASIKEWVYLYTAIGELAPYDEEMSSIMKNFKEVYGDNSIESAMSQYSTSKKSAEIYMKYKDTFVKLRNELLNNVYLF